MNNVAVVETATLVLPSFADPVIVKLKLFGAESSLLGTKMSTTRSPVVGVLLGETVNPKSVILGVVVW